MSTLRTYKADIKDKDSDVGDCYLACVDDTEIQEPPSELMKSLESEAQGFFGIAGPAFPVLGLYFANRAIRSRGAISPQMISFFTMAAMAPTLYWTYWSTRYMLGVKGRKSYDPFLIMLAGFIAYINNQFPPCQQAKSPSGEGILMAGAVVSGLLRVIYSNLYRS